MATAFDIDAFKKNPDLVAMLASSEDVFSLLNRQITVPPSCVALVWGADSRPWVVDAGQALAANVVEEFLLVRTSSVFLDYDVGQVFSQDGYEFRADVRISISIVKDRTDIASFRKAVIGSSNRVSTDDLKRHCAEAVQSALVAFAGTMSAAELASSPAWESFDCFLIERFKPVGFESGLSLGNDPRVTFSSSAFEESRKVEQTTQRRMQAIAADEQLREAVAQARRRHLAGLGTLLEQVRDMADKSGGIDVADLIKAFDAGQRGALYEGLVALNRLVRKTRAVLVIAGQEIVWLDPSSPARPIQKQMLDGGNGPLRSIRVTRVDGNIALLVGAKRGVHIVDPESGPKQAFSLPETFQPKGGVNAAVITDQDVFATHSEVGLIRWSRGNADIAELCLEDVTQSARSVRELQVDDEGRLWFAVNSLVVGWHPQRDDAPTILPTQAEVVAVLARDNAVFAGLSNGAVLRWPNGRAEDAEMIRQYGGLPIRSLGWLSGGGIPRLLIADGSPCVDLEVLGDAFRGQYRANRPVRWAYGADDFLVGVDAARDQVIFWKIEQPAQPTAMVSIGRLTGRSIHDVAILPAEAPDVSTASDSKVEPSNGADVET